MEKTASCKAARFVLSQKNITQVIKFRMMRWVGHEPCMRQKKNAHKCLVGNVRDIDHFEDLGVHDVAMKQPDLIFFCFPVNLATDSSAWYWLVLSYPFTATISRSCGKQIGSSLCLKWIVFLFSVGIVLSVNVEQQVNVKFCMRTGKFTTETYKLLKKVYDDECLSHTQVFEWFRRFKEGRKGIRDNQHPSHPSTLKTDVNIEKFG
jgi:hypothetical protein